MTFQITQITSRSFEIFPRFQKFQKNAMLLLKAENGVKNHLAIVKFKNPRSQTWRRMGRTARVYRKINNRRTRKTNRVHFKFSCEGLYEKNRRKCLRKSKISGTRPWIFRIDIFHELEQGNWGTKGNLRTKIQHVHESPIYVLFIDSIVILEST